MNILDENVLILNKHFLAIQVCSVREAIIILYKGNAKVIDENWRQYTFDQWESRSSFIIDTPEEKKYYGIIHSPKHWLLAPQVIILTNYAEKLPDIKQIRFSRKNVMVRDQYVCQYCGHTGTTANLTLDHVLPRSRGGLSSYSNIVTACKLCNSKKGNKTPEEAGMKLLKKPITPQWQSHTGSRFKKKEYWNRFLA